MKEKVYRAGVIPFFINENNEIEMYFMVPSDSHYGGDSPQFCKGKVEKGETEEQAAIREAAEELGLKEKNVEWFSYLGVFLGRTYIYICEVKNKEDFDEPHFETASTHWLTLDQFEKHGRELHRPVIREAHNEFLAIKDEEEEGVYGGESEYEYDVSFDH